MAEGSRLRTYAIADCAVFRKTNERFGGLSNMAAGFPLIVNDVHLPTSEALYQACRFPHMPEVQRLIVRQNSPMTAKMKSKPYRKDSRPDWDHVRVKVMRWCLRVKLAQNWSKFGDLLLATGHRPIVEESRKDAFWAAKPIDDQILEGMNVLGRLLMELREELRSGSQSLRSVEPLGIPQFLLFGDPIKLTHSGTTIPAAAPDLFASATTVPGERAAMPTTADLTNEELRSEQSSFDSVAPPNYPIEPVTRKKLIEVALPLEAINKASAREKSIRHGHPSTLHLWWARRPLAAARAVIFAQMVDDPSSHPELFPTDEAQDEERQRLFRLIEDLVLWENTTNEKVLSAARQEIWKSWRATCADNKDHPRAKELFNPDRLPAFHDPFAGGGTLPLEAQRLGLESYASDLNPVAVLINKAMIEIPPRFAGRPPVNPAMRKEKGLIERAWRGAQGLAEDVRYYGQWMRDEAEKRIGHLYPKVEITPQMASERPDLNPYLGKNLNVIAWLWARTVKSPNPAFAQVDVPLVSTFVLASKPGKEAYVEPLIQDGGYCFRVKVGKARRTEATKNGTRTSTGANFECLMSKTPITAEYIRAEARAGHMGARLMAVVVEGDRERVYLPPTPDMEAIALSTKPEWRPDLEFLQQALGFRVGNYGMTRWSDLFTDRQTVALTTFSDLVQKTREQVRGDALAAGLLDDGKSLDTGGAGASGYADAVAIYLAFAVDKSAVYWNSLCPWLNQPKNEIVGNSFGRQTVQMVWDYAEANPFCDSGGNIEKQLDYVCKVIAMNSAPTVGRAYQADAAVQTLSQDCIVSCDPPYYDNIGYADLSDFFYVWLRRSLKPLFPEIFATLAVSKAEELVATPHRHGGRDKAERFFLEGMTKAMRRLAEQAHPAFPVTIYYAFKQSEAEGDTGTASTGWETFLDAVIRAGFSTSGTWPIRTERPGRMRDHASNALASSILLVCRPRAADAPTATRREFLTALKTELPMALANLQRSNIAPVDLAQAAIGPGMSVYTRYSKVIDAEGKKLPVREALALINQTLDEVLAEQEGDFDADSRWALAWFDQSGFDAGEYGVAEMLSKAKNTSVPGMVLAGILVSKGGRVRLLRPDELPPDWDPETDPRLTAWESVHHLVRALEAGGEGAAAELVARLGSKAEPARELCYRLYTLCERKKRAAQALSYNALVQSWPEITRLVRDGAKPQPSQTKMFEQE